MLGFVRRMVFLTGLSLAVGCFSSVSPGPQGSTGDGASTAGSGTAATGSTGGAQCGGVCAPAPPSGWEGPVALWEGPPTDPPASCAGPFDLEGPVMFGDLDPGQAQCACDCEAAEGIDCGTQVEIELYSPVTLCTNLSPPTELVAINGCTPLTTGQQKFGVVEPEAKGGTCAPVEAHDLPAPKWGMRAVACGSTASSGDGCEGDQVCAPELADPFTASCIYRAGDVSCPLGFSDRRVRYEGFTDTRACGACSCEPPVAQCNAEVDLTTNGCSILLETVTSAQSCSGALTPEDAHATVMPSGECAPSPSELAGEVTPDGAVTFCCLP